MELHVDLTPAALVTTVALVFGLLLSRLRQPAIVGYIIAGAVMGPAGLGLIEATEAVQTLAEIGVLMLLFIVGLELDLKAFRAVYRTAVGTVLLQTLISVAFMFLVGQFFDWSPARSVLLGFVLALSSTAVAFKMLEERGDTETRVGQLCIGIMIAQDLALVPMLIVIGAMGVSVGGEGGGAAPLLIKLGLAVAGLGALIYTLLHYGPIRIPVRQSERRNADIGTLAIMAFCFVLASATGLLGLSPQLGAFLAGLIVGNSTVAHEANRMAVPIQSILLVMFFLSVGLLIDIGYLVENWPEVLLVLSIVIVLKTVMNIGILRLLREPSSQALPAGLFMAHVGEFSFVLAAAGLAAGVIDGGGYRLAIMVIALTLVISPVWYAMAQRFLDIARNGITGVRQSLRQLYVGELDLFANFAGVPDRPGRHRGTDDAPRERPDEL